MQTSRYGPRLCILPSLLIATLATPLAAAEPPWRTTVLDGSTLTGCKVEGEFRTLPAGGPMGGPAVVFDSPGKSRGRIEIDLSGIEPPERPGDDVSSRGGYRP